jgi:cell division protein FtsA
MRKRGEEIVVGLDIGTTKTCCIVAEVTDRGVDIIGIGSHESRGLRKGVVVNLDSTVESIRRAVDEAELMAGCDISTVYVGIAGAHIQGFNSKGIVAIKDQEVTAADVERVIDAAKAVPMNQDRELIHVLPQEFLIDDCDGVREPIGMSGVRLEARVHVVSAARAAVDNIRRCAQRTNLHIQEIVLEQVASAHAVLSDDERELGVAVVDIGGGTTDVAVFYNGAIVFSSVLPLGGQHVTADIACGLRTPKAEAEKIKQTYGCALTAMVAPEETIDVPSVGGRDPQVRGRQLLCEIIEPRCEEMLGLVLEEIRRSGYEDVLSSGVVLTGGAAVLPGMVELGEEVLGMPVRLGVPASDIGGLADVVRNPKFATAVGLVKWGALRSQPNHQVARPGRQSGRTKHLGQRFFDWIRQAI